MGKLCIGTLFLLFFSLLRTPLTHHHQLWTHPTRTAGTWRSCTHFLHPCTKRLVLQSQDAKEPVQRRLRTRTQRWQRIAIYPHLCWRCGWRAKSPLHRRLSCQRPSSRGTWAGGPRVGMDSALHHGTRPGGRNPDDTARTYGRFRTLPPFSFGVQSPVNIHRLPPPAVCYVGAWGPRVLSSSHRQPTHTPHRSFTVPLRSSAMTPPNALMWNLRCF